MKLSHKIFIGLVIVGIGVIIQSTHDNQPVTPTPHVFSVVDYNTALSEYNNQQYAIAYNTLLNDNAPRKAIKALFPNIK